MRIFTLFLVLTFALTANAERGRGIVLKVPSAGDVATFADEWNNELGREFDMVAYSVTDGQTPDAIAPFELSIKAAMVDGVEDADGIELPEHVEWLVVDMRAASSPQADAFEQLQATLSDSDKLLAVIPPEESALDWAPAVAPHVNAYFIVESDLSLEGLESLQYAAYSVHKANGLCGIGCMIDATNVTQTDDAQEILDFINRTDEFIKFFAIEWNDDPAVISNLLDWLNPRIEGPKPSLGMHQDRLRPPERKLAPETEAWLAKLKAISATVFLVVIVFVVFVVFKPVTRMPPEEG